MEQNTKQTDEQILAEYQNGLEPLLDLPAALKVIQEAGFKDAGEHGYYKSFYHPDYDDYNGPIHCKDEQEVLGMAEALAEAEKAMQETLQEALPELSDEEAARLAKEASKRW